MAVGSAGLQTGTARRRRAIRLRFFLPAVLLAAGVFGPACGGDGAAPTTPEPPETPAALDVPFGFTDLEEGAGPEVHDGWLLAIAYTGWLYDEAAPGNKGSEFISVTGDDPDSFRFGVGQVIPGVDRGMAGMRVGGKRRIVVPPDLGFGPQGNNLVPGNATLLFEVDLVAGAEVPFETTDLLVGSGEEAENGDSLSMAYHGWVFDLLAPDNKGDTFDSTTAEDPFDFTLGVGAVIVGWDLGIVGMRVGGRRRIVIPHELAYGAAGRQPRIPAYATLLFEVELLAVN